MNTTPKVNELLLKEEGYDLVIGVDEAGRGAIAGPVVCAGVYFSEDSPLIENITDSKKIKSEADRENLYNAIIKCKGVAWYVSVIQAEKIDEINILNATMLGMKTCLNKLVEDTLGYKFVGLIDGNKVPDNVLCDCKSIVGGDDSEYVIAAASIIAKVTRDRLMNYFELCNPDFTFSKHKGYPTKKHKKELEETGVIDYFHRKSFKPVKKYL